jgi:hypothetical protein
MTLEEMEKRLKIVEDIEEIKQLQQHYVDCLCLTKWDEIGECFTENAETNIGEEANIRRLKGKAEISKVYKVSKAHIGQEGLFVVHPSIQVNGDRATGRWLSYFMHIRPKGEEPLLHWMQGIYECQYVRENGKWKISYLKWRARLKYKQSQMQVYRVT